MSHDWEGERESERDRRLLELETCLAHFNDEVSTEAEKYPKCNLQELAYASWDTGTGLYIN